jgi:hypothetical protein
MQPAVSLQNRVEDVPTIDAAPAFEPPFSAAFLKIKEVVSRHVPLAASTSHVIPPLAFV